MHQLVLQSRCGSLEQITNAFAMTKSSTLWQTVKIIRIADFTEIFEWSVPSCSNTVTRPVIEEETQLLFVRCPNQVGAL